MLDSHGISTPFDGVAKPDFFVNEKSGKPYPLGLAFGCLDSLEFVLIRTHIYLLGSFSAIASYAARAFNRGGTIARRSPDAL